MKKKIIISMLLCTSILFGVENNEIKKENASILNKGSFQTFKELGLKRFNIKNVKIDNSELIIDINKRFEKSFKFKTKPYKYYKFLESFNIDNKKLKIISDISMETGLFLISKKMYKPDENKTISQQEIAISNFDLRAKKIFMLRYLYILKDYPIDDLSIFLDFYKTKEYQNALRKTINSISLTSGENYFEQNKFILKTSSIENDFR